MNILETVRKRYFEEKKVKSLACLFLGYPWKLLILNMLNLFENTLIMTSRYINIDIDYDRYRGCYRYRLETCSIVQTFLTF